MAEIYEIKNLLNAHEVKETYDLLMQQNWNINTISQSEQIYKDLYPHFCVKNQDQICSPYWWGYFRALFAGANKSIKKDYNFQLSNYSIKGIFMNAQKNKGSFHFHDHVERWTCVGFLSPYWRDEWGGELQVEDTKITFEPGSFVLFKGHYLHDAMPVKVDLPFWRVSMAMFIDA